MCFELEADASYVHGKEEKGRDVGGNITWNVLTDPISHA